MFHGACEGIMDLRGFHMKRGSWKCSGCSQSAVIDPISRKRFKNDSGDVIEVDRAKFEQLLEFVKKLTVSVEDMKSQLTSVQDQNRKLSEMVSLLAAKDKPLSVPTSFSYASAVNNNNKAGVNGSSSSKTNNTPFRFGKESVPPNNIPRPAVTGSDQAGEKDKDDDAPFVTGGKPKRKRTMKPLIIGSGESSSSSDNSSKQVTSLVGTERRQWVYVGRVTAGTSADTVIEHVKSTWNISDVMCHPLANNDDLCSFKIGVRESLIASLLDATKWPKHIAVREFVQFPRSQGKGKKPTTANFQSSVTVQAVT